MTDLIESNRGSCSHDVTSTCSGVDAEPVEVVGEILGSRNRAGTDRGELSRAGVREAARLDQIPVHRGLRRAPPETSQSCELVDGGCGIGLDPALRVADVADQRRRDLGGWLFANDSLATKKA